MFKRMIALMLFLLAFTPASAQTTITIYPMPGNTNSPTQPFHACGNMTSFLQGGQFYAYNFGDDSHMRVGTMQKPPPNQNEWYEQGIPYLRFNLDAIPRGASITSAKLYLVPDGQGTSGTTKVDTYVNLQAWGQWDVLQSTQGVNLNDTTELNEVQMDPSNPSTCVIDVTTPVKSWYAGTTRNYGVNLEPNGAGGLEFYSNQTGSLTNFPSLQVTYSTSSDPSVPANAGAARPWQASIPLNPHQVVNLANGNVLTTLPITGWSGFGPAVSLSLVHNSQEKESANAAHISSKWQLNYSSRLDLSQLASNIITWIGPDGSRNTYNNPQTAGGVTTWTSPAGVYDQLTQSTTSGSPFVLMHPDQVEDTYDGTGGQLLSIIDTSLLAGNEVDMGYTSGVLTKITDANPTSGNRRSISLSYTNNQLTTITDPLNRQWSLSYDGNGDLAEVKEPQRTDGTSNHEYAYVFAYDVSVDGIDGHNVAQIGEPDQNETNQGYNTYIWSTEYDGSGRGVACLGREKQPSRGLYGVYLSYGSGYTAVDDETFVHQKYTWDGNGNLASVTTVTNPTVAESSWTGLTTTMGWDSANVHNLDHIRVPGDPATLNGNPWWTKDFTYETGDAHPGSRGNLASETTHVIDSPGGSEDNTLRQVTTYTYDTGGHNRVYTVTSTADGTNYPSVVNHVTTFQYDGVSNGWMKLTQVQQYDSNALTTTWTESYAYWLDTQYPGKVETRTDRNGNAWTYNYDNYGNLTKTTSPGTTNRTTSAQYSAATAFTLPDTTTDAASTVTTYNYHTTGTNPDHLLTSQSVSNGTKSDTYFWTPNGQFSQGRNGISGADAVNESHTYTDGGLPITVILTTYTYDSMGRRLSMGYTTLVDKAQQYGARTVNYTYDALGRISSKTLIMPPTLLIPPGIPNPSISYVYDPNTGNLSEQDDSNNTRTQFFYNNVGQETGRNYASHQTGSWVDFDDWAVTRRADGLVMGLTRNSKNYRGMQYDALGQLFNEDDYDPTTGLLAGSQTFSYDANGNRTAWYQYDGSNNFLGGSTSSYDVGNQLQWVKHWVAPVYTLHDTVNFSAGSGFDGAGNETLSTDQNQSTSYTYYLDHRLDQTTSPSGPSVNGYYLDGRLLYNTDQNGNSPKYFYYDGGNRLQKTDSTTQIGTTWGGLPTTEEYLGGDLTILYNYSSLSPNQFQSITEIWMHDDPTGSLGVMSGSSGGTSNGLCSSDLYGTNPKQNGSSSTNEFQWNCAAGYVFNSSPTPGGVYQLENRAYDPAQGRFLQQDPISDGQGDWTYAGNSPANAVDPTGLAVQLLYGSYPDCASAKSAIISEDKKLIHEVDNPELLKMPPATSLYTPVQGLFRDWDKHWPEVERLQEIVRWDTTNFALACGYYPNTFDVPDLYGSMFWYTETKKPEKQFHWFLDPYDPDALPLEVTPDPFPEFGPY